MKKGIGMLAVALVAAEGVCSVPNSSAEIGNVRLKGSLGDRLDMMIERHVIGTDVDYITAPFLEKTERRGWWRSRKAILATIRTICGVVRAGTCGA